MKNGAAARNRKRSRINDLCDLNAIYYNLRSTCQQIFYVLLLFKIFFFEDTGTEKLTRHVSLNYLRLNFLSIK